MSEPIILNDSPEAAEQRTVTGWYDRFGQYFGGDERTARWSGSTHVKCSECGAVIEKHRSKCESCHLKERIALFNTFEVETWDGDTPVVLFGTDRYFFGESILDFIADSDPEKDSELHICKCRPNYLHLVDRDEWVDELPEDGDLADDVQAAVDALNKVIKKAGPVSWTEDSIAIDARDLRARLSASAYSGRQV